MSKEKTVPNGVVAVPSFHTTVVNDGTWTHLDEVGDSEEKDIEGEHATGTFTVKRTGIYMFACVQGMSQVNNNNRWMNRITVNGNDYIHLFTETQGRLTSYDALMGNSGALLDLEKGDVVKIYGYQDAGGTTDTYTSGGRYQGLRFIYLGSKF